MFKKILIAVGAIIVLFLVIGIIGAVVGVDSASSPSPGATTTVTAQPDPAPTQTVTSAPKTVTKQVPVTPQSCIDSLDQAEAIVHKVPTLTTISQKYIGLIPRAYQAGMNGGVGAQAVVNEIHSLTAQSKALAQELHPMIARYNAISDQCRASQ